MAFGRNLYVLGGDGAGGRGGVGMGNGLLPFLYTRLKWRVKVPKTAVGQSSVILTSPS